MRDAERDALRGQLAARDALLAWPELRAAKLLRACREDTKLLRPPRPAKLDDVLQYVALTNVDVSAQAFGLTKAFWRDEEQMHWALAKARYGKGKMTRLMWACKCGLLPRVIELIAWSSDVNAQDELGRTPLFFASGWGRLEVARELLACGAKLEAKTKRGNTALHWASFWGHTALVRLLLDAGVQIEAKTNNGCTPLYLASQEGHIEVVRLLLERGADVNARAIENFTALHMASLKGNAKIVRELLTHSPAINAQADSGRTPLMNACKAGHLVAATLLLDAGADQALLNNAGWSALRWAERRVTLDAEPPAAGTGPLTALQRRKHKVLVTLLSEDDDSDDDDDE